MMCRLVITLTCPKLHQELVIVQTIDLDSVTLATFTAGSAIRATDLNKNFALLLELIKQNAND